jgi:hypothetical protein
MISLGAVGISTLLAQASKMILEFSQDKKCEFIDD